MFDRKERLKRRREGRKKERMKRKKKASKLACSEVPRLNMSSKFLTFWGR